MIYTKYKCRICEAINEYVHEHVKIDTKKNKDVLRMSHIRLFYFERLCDQYYCEHCKLETMHDLCAVIGNEE